ncbi:MAG: BlaI/MecI/CopY family transcriptional regulator [Proteocatella sp.]|nr:BlaI/MecI/CopY family transcriptional regulator [Proteocatella sp.]MBP8654105.1 BlaI/MecI/CopY family transcriptional regulator [Proteocatella sp.]MBP9966582.1 BlaI/MecI/CopY family transcriptional regulator [Proteocatella sp.]
MERIRIFDAELKMMEILWKNEPMSTGELSKMCAEQLNWNKSTTYTVIRRLVDRGVLNKNRTILTSRLSKKMVQFTESEEHIEKMYGGSLKKFFETYLKHADLRDEEIKLLRDILEEKQVC